MTKPTFLTYNKPLLCCMVQAETPDRINELIALSLPEGAEAFGMQLCRLKPEFRRPEIYRELFNRPDGLPTYVTNYRFFENSGKSDDVLAQELLELAECGATLCDVMGDYYGITKGELTLNPEAISKQMKLIDNLHERGAEVLMSSHVSKFIPAEQVLEIALEHQRRGADICKIVTDGSDMAAQIENIRIIDLLKRELDIPFLYLAGGECRILRRLGGHVGNCMSLCVHEYDKIATREQPILREMKAIRDLI